MSKGAVGSLHLAGAWELSGILRAQIARLERLRAVMEGASNVRTHARREPWLLRPGQRVDRWMCDSAAVRDRAFPRRTRVAGDQPAKLGGLDLAVSGDERRRPLRARRQRVHHASGRSVAHRSNGPILRPTAQRARLSALDRAARLDRAAFANRASAAFRTHDRITRHQRSGADISGRLE